MTQVFEISDKVQKEVTKEKCNKCGEKIKRMKVKILGITRYYPVMCDCIKKELKQKDVESQERQKREKLSRLFRQSRLGERFKNSTFSKVVVNEHNKNTVNSLKHFAENFNENKKRSFLMYSHPGTGKTLMASAVVNYLVNKGISAIFVTVPDLLTQIRASFNNRANETEEQILNGLADCSLLVLDDLGAENNKDWATEKLFQIINNRYNNMKATIFTTNCNSRELQDRLGKRTFSRICEMASETDRFNLEKEIDWRLMK